MTDPSDAGQERRLNIRLPDEIRRGEYANFLLVTHSAHEFTLDFCQIQPGEEPDSTTAEVISRVRVAPTLVARIIQALNTNLGNYEDRYGQVKAVG